MNDANRRSVEAFTRRAEGYGGYFSGEEQERLDGMARRIGFGPGSRLVDFGMGTATSALPFLKAGGRVVGLELTPAMVRSGRARLREWGVQARARYVLADAGAPPLAEGAADAAVCRHTLHHLENPGGVFREMARSVRPGGHLFLIDYHYPDEAAERARIESLDRAREPSITRHLSQKEMEALFEEEGVRVEEVAFDRLDARFDEWMNASHAPPGAVPALRRAFEALRDEGGSWYEERGAGAELSITRKRLTILGRKAP